MDGEIDGGGCWLGGYCNCVRDTHKESTKSLSQRTLFLRRSYKRLPTRVQEGVFFSFFILYFSMKSPS